MREEGKEGGMEEGEREGGKRREGGREGGRREGGGREEGIRRRLEEGKINQEKGTGELYTTTHSPQHHG